ncbi:UNVERIFIED_CONTAM: hypothetical protein P3D59_31810, partial [Pseudomonas aeruginosa]
MPSPKPLGAIVEHLVPWIRPARPASSWWTVALDHVLQVATRTWPIRVKRRAPGSSKRLHRSGERTHGQSVRL